MSRSISSPLLDLFDAETSSQHPALPKSLGHYSILQSSPKVPHSQAPSLSNDSTAFQNQGSQNGSSSPTPPPTEAPIPISVWWCFVINNDRRI